MGAPGPEPKSNTALIAAIAVLGTLVVVGIIALIVVSRSGSDDASSDAGTTTVPQVLATTEPSTTTTTASTTTTTTTTVPATTATTSAPSGPGDVIAQPAGLFCRDLKAKGYSYSAAIDYWRFQGQPDRMDADGNGIPCETVYPRASVIAYWGSTTMPEYQNVPTGLLCRDLKARGYSYAEAAAYWFATGAPDNMDADKNGIPCETVYPAAEVQDYWYG